VERGQERADAGEERHVHVHVVGEVVQEGNLVQLLLLKNQGHVLNDEHQAVAGDAEDDFRQHGVDVRVPVAEPRTDRLADVHGEHEHGARVADEPDDDRQVDDVLKLVDFEDVLEESGEERTSAQGDDRQVEGDPQAESEVVVQTGDHDAFRKDDDHRIQAEQEEGRDECHPQREFAEGAALHAIGKECSIHCCAP
jgi:hypothetical protein